MENADTYFGKQLYLAKTKLKCKIRLSVPNVTLDNVCENIVKNIKPT